MTIAELFNDPDPVEIYNLDKTGFREFIAYIFERAGFKVEVGPAQGPDLIINTAFDNYAIVALSHNVQ